MYKTHKTYKKKHQLENIEQPAHGRVAVQKELLYIYM